MLLVAAASEHVDGIWSGRPACARGRVDGRGAGGGADTPKSNKADSSTQLSELPDLQPNPSTSPGRF